MRPARKTASLSEHCHGPLYSAQLKLRAAHQHTKNGRAATAPRGLSGWCDDSRFGRNKSGVMQICGVLHSEAKQQAARSATMPGSFIRLALQKVLLLAFKKRLLTLTRLAEGHLTLPEFCKIPAVEKALNPSRWWHAHDLAFMLSTYCQRQSAAT